jgi:hypothetical protein
MTRGEIPITLTAADETRRSIGIIRDAVAALAKDQDLVAVCIVSAIGLAFSVAFALAPPVTGDSIQLFAEALAR